MKENAGRMAAVCVMAFAVLAGCCRADEPVGMGSASLIVRGPQGTPLPHQDVRFFLADRRFSKEVIPQSVTDALGRVTVRLPAGLHRLRITAPGIGFGSTGLLVIRADQKVTVSLPPLAAFAHLSGTVPVGLRAPGEVVGIVNSFSNRAERIPSVLVDVAGHFEINDVYPGVISLALDAGPAHDAFCQVEVAPGERRIVDEFTDFFPGPYSITVGAAEKPEAIVAIHGTVMDTSAIPVPGAAVYAQVPTLDPSFLELRNEQRPPLPPRKAITDANGHYVLPAVALGGRQYRITMWAEHAGFPRAGLVLWTTAHQHSDLKADLVLPKQHTALTVHLVRDGSPLAGAQVVVCPLWFGPGVLNPSVPLLSDDTDAWWQPLAGCLTARTGAGGAVRFVDLPPGLWSVGAMGRTGSDVLPVNRGTVAVQAGRAVTYTQQVTPPVTTNLTVLAFSPDGRPLAVQGGSIGSVMAAGLEGGDGTTLISTPSGQYHASLKQPGLWRVTVHTRDFVMPQDNWQPDTTGPYLEASALVATSDDLAAPTPLRLRSQRREPATVRVQLEDASGKPARGTVFLRDQFMPAYAATTDSEGVADFPEMPSGKYTLSGYLAGQPAPTMMSAVGVPLPDAALIGQTRIVPQEITVGADDRSVIYLHPQPVGYLRLHLKLTPPETLKDFRLSDTSRPDEWQTFPSQQKNEQTDEILYGPIPVGADSLYVTRFLSDNPFSRADTASLDVRQDMVASVTLTPTPAPAASGDPEAFDQVLGTILLSDGKTPAWQAHAVLCKPEQGQPHPFLRPQEPTDARGRLLGTTSSFAGTFVPEPLVVNGRVLPPKPPSGSDPGEPVVVAWLPGLTGAAIVPYIRGQAERIVLPPSLAVNGQVTVAGHPINGLHSTFRVRAAYQGHGVLNDLLTLDAIAQPDGSFTLPGLTPGTYRVQAARDGIWLSPPQTLTVKDTPPPPLTFDIPAPGVPMDLHLTDPQGAVLPGQVVALDIAGPLAALFWPAAVTADGAGDLHLDGLTAGRHVLRALGADTSGGAPLATFDVPPLSGNAPRVPVRRSLVLRLIPRVVETMP